MFKKTTKFPFDKKDESQLINVNIPLNIKVRLRDSGKKESIMKRGVINWNGSTYIVWLPYFQGEKLEKHVFSKLEKDNKGDPFLTFLYFDDTPESPDAKKMCLWNEFLLQSQSKSLFKDVLKFLPEQEAIIINVAKENDRRGF